MSSADPLDQPPQRPSFDTFKPQQFSSARGWSLIIQGALLAIGVVLCARVVWTQFSAQPPAVTPASQASAPAKPATASTTAAAAPPAVSEAPPARPLDRHQEMRLDVAQAQQREFLNQSEKLQSSLGLWQSELDQWQQQVVPLLTNEGGKKLAVAPAAVQSFRALYEQQRPPQARLDQIRDVADQLTRTVSAAHRDPQNALVPDPTALAQLTKLSDEVQAADESYRSARLQITALLHQAERAGTPSAKTLQDAMAKQLDEEQLAAAEKSRQRFERAQQEANEQIAKAKEEAIRLAGETQARQIVEAANAVKSQQLAEEQRQQQQQAKAKRLANMQRDMPEIRRYLRPFLLSGYTQPGNTDNIQTGDSTPVSLSKLTAMGALRDGREGMEKLMRVATVNNDRDHGAFPQYLGGERGWQETNKEFLKRAEQLLHDYGDLLVEQGLLSP